MSKRFKKTVLRVEVLSDKEWNWGTLTDVAYAITEGDCSGTVSTVSNESLSDEETARALIAQGSDPGFLLGAEWAGWEPPDEASDE